MERILVGYDGSEPAAHALEQASRLARALGARMTVLTAAADRLRREDGVLTVAVDEDLARRVAEEGAARARAAGAAEVDTRISVEAPTEALAHAAGDGYTLLVVGHASHGRFQEFFTGSTAKDVIDHVRCSVLVVR
jgi:nucleotide-binding universal stress UspA family protein